MPLKKMDLKQFNDLFLRVIELNFSMLAYVVAMSGGPTVINSQFLIAGSLLFQIRESIRGHTIRFWKGDVYISHKQ